MADQVLLNPKLYANQWDVSGDLMAMALNHGVAQVEATKSGATTRTVKGGLKETSFEASGAVNLGLDLSDEEMQALVGVTGTVITIAPSGAEGEFGFSMKALLAACKRDGKIGDLHKFVLSGKSDSNNPIVRGTVMHAAADTRTATANGTARQVGVVSATQKVYAILHVISASAGDTLDVKIQSDTVGFPSPTDRITFLQAAPGVNLTQWMELGPGAITDDYWRVVYTLGGAGMSFNFVVVLAIQ